MVSFGEGTKVRYLQQSASASIDWLVRDKKAISQEYSVNIAISIVSLYWVAVDYTGYLSKGLGDENGFAWAINCGIAAVTPPFVCFCRFFVRKFAWNCKLPRIKMPRILFKLKLCIK